MTVGLLYLRLVEDFTQLWQVMAAFLLTCGLSLGTFLVVSSKPDERAALARALHLRPRASQD